MPYRTGCFVDAVSERDRLLTPTVVGVDLVLTHADSWLISGWRVGETGSSARWELDTHDGEITTALVALWCVRALQAADDGREAVRHLPTNAQVDKQYFEEALKSLSNKTKWLL